MWGGEIDVAGRARLVQVRVWVSLCPNFLASLSPLRSEGGRLIFLLSRRTAATQAALTYLTSPTGRKTLACEPTKA